MTLGANPPLPGKCRTCKAVKRLNNFNTASVNLTWGPKSYIQAMNNVKPMPVF